MLMETLRRASTGITTGGKNNKLPVNCFGKGQEAFKACTTIFCV